MGESFREVLKTYPVTIQCACVCKFLGHINLNKRKKRFQSSKPFVYLKTGRQSGLFGRRDSKPQSLYAILIEPIKQIIVFE